MTDSQNLPLLAKYDTNIAYVELSDPARAEKAQTSSPPDSGPISACFDCDSQGRIFLSVASIPVVTTRFPVDSCTNEEEARLWRTPSFYFPKNSVD